MKVAKVIQDWLVIFTPSFMFDSPSSSLQLWRYFLAFSAARCSNYTAFRERAVGGSDGSESVAKLDTTTNGLPDILGRGILGLKSGIFLMISLTIFSHL